LETIKQPLQQNGRLPSQMGLWGSRKEHSAHTSDMSSKNVMYLLESRNAHNRHKIFFPFDTDTVTDTDTEPPRIGIGHGIGIGIERKKKSR
jgi:hypothetical protein